MNKLVFAIAHMGIFIFFLFFATVVEAEEIKTTVVVSPEIQHKPVVVILPHQDDELFMAGAIQQYLKTKRNVYVVIVSDGGASAARAKINGRDEFGNTIMSELLGRRLIPKKEGYWPLSKQAFSGARNQEVIRSLLILGVPRKHISFLNPGDARGTKNPIFQDGKLMNSATDAIARMYKRFGDGTYLSVAGGHDDHVALEEALKMQEGITEKIFFPFTIEGLDDAIYLTPEEFATKQKAVHVYEEWRPRQGKFAVGAHSVPDLLARWRSEEKEYFYRW